MLKSETNIKSDKYIEKSRVKSDPYFIRVEPVIFKIIKNLFVRVKTNEKLSLQIEIKNKPRNTVPKVS